MPLPGIDPQDVNLEAAGNTLSIRAEVPQGEGRGNQVRYQKNRDRAAVPRRREA